MIISWFKKQRRQAVLEAPFPDQWQEFLLENVRHYRRLPGADQASLRNHVQVFIAEKYWEGCGGLAISDEIKVTIAAGACLLLLGLEHDFYPRVMTVLVYPAGYVARENGIDEWGVVHRAVHRLGEAWYRGPVIVSWSDSLRDSRQGHDGHNVVLHEFAHQLDMEDRTIDGTPPLASRQQYRQWHEVMTREYERLLAAVKKGEPTLLDWYGAEDPSEFFAVATECFFERSSDLAERHPELYGVLSDFYRQDPALWA